VGGGLLPEPIQGLADSPSTGTAVSGVLLQTTASTPVLTYTPPATQGLNVIGSVEVTTAPTQVLVSIQWTAPSGAAQTLWWTAQTGWALQPGDYSFVPANITAAGGNPVTVYVQAMTAGQVSFSGAIWADV
jgi:hypothetical protein